LAQAGEPFGLTRSISLEDIWRLVSTLNKGLSKPLPEAKLGEAFGVWWNQLDERLKKVTLSTKLVHPTKRNLEDMVEELLTLGRDQSRIMHTFGASMTQLINTELIKNLYTPINTWPPSTNLRNLMGAGDLSDFAAFAANQPKGTTPIPTQQHESDDDEIG
jgi:hypothetical protein